MILRELFAKLGLDVDAASFAKGELAASAVKKALEKLYEVAEKVALAIPRIAKETVEYGGELDDTSQAIGVQTDALQELRYAGSMAGISTEELTISIRLLSSHLQAAKEGSAEAGKLFASLGIAAKDGSGKLRAADEVIADVADHFAAMPDGAEKTALALQLFGRSGAKMVPMLNEGAAGLARLRGEARSLGIVLSGEAIKQADEIGDTVEGLTATFAGMRRALGQELLPPLLAVIRGVKAWVLANKELIRSPFVATGKAVAAVLRGVGKVAKFVFENFDAIVALLKGAAFVLAVRGAIFAIGALATALGNMAALEIAAAAGSVALAASMALAWVAAGAGIYAVLRLVQSFIRYKQGKDSVVGDWIKMLDEWQKPLAKDPPWLRWIKEFVSKTREALGLAGQLMDKLGFTDEKQEPTKFGSNTRTLGVSARVDQIFGRGEFASVPTAPTSQGGTWSPNVSAIFNVTQAPGQSAGDVAGVLRAEWESWWNIKMEGAAASTP